MAAVFKTLSLEALFKSKTIYGILDEAEHKAKLKSKGRIKL